MFLGDSRTYKFKGPRQAVVRDVAKLLWTKGVRVGDPILRERSGSGLSDLPEERTREDWTSLISFANKLVAPRDALEPAGLGAMAGAWDSIAKVALPLAMGYLGGGYGGGGDSPYSSPNGAAQQPQGGQPQQQQQQTTGVQPTSGQGTQTSQSVVTSQNVNVQTGGTQGGFAPGAVSATQTPSFSQDISPSMSQSPSQSMGPQGQSPYGQYPQYPYYPQQGSQPYYPQYGNPQIPLQGAYTSQGAALPQTVTGAPTSYSGSMGGIPMSYLLIGAAAIAAVFLLKKR